MPSVIVNITATTVTPSRESFGTPLVAAFLGTSPPWTDLYREYASHSAAVADGIVDSGATKATYNALAIAFAQNPRPQKVAVGRLTTAPSRAYTITVSTAVVGALMKVTVGGQSVTVAQTTTVVNTEATALKAALDLVAGAGGFTTAIATNVITITPSVVSQPLRIAGLTQNLVFTETTVDPAMSAGLDAIKAANNTWYGLALTGAGRLEIAAAASWAQTNKKLFFPISADSDCFNSGVSTDALSVAKTASQDHFVGTYTNDNWNQIGFAALALGLAKDAGTFTYKFKTFSNVNYDSLTDTQIANIKAKNGNVYSQEFGVPIFSEGTTAKTGTFADQTHGLDWLISEVQFNVFSVLASADKVPFTAKGTDIPVGGTKQALAEGVRRTFLNPGYTVTTPDPATLTAAQRATRKMTIEFQAVFQGAVHEVTINGTVSA